MKNKFILFGIIAVIVVAGASLIFKGSGKNTADNNSDSNVIVTEEENVPSGSADVNTVNSDICSTFSKESIASVTGLDIVSAEVYSVEGSVNSNCRYYVRGKSYAPVLSVSKYESDPLAAKQKYTKVPFEDWRIGTSSQIPMENFITYNEVQQLNDIYLITGTNEYYRITLHSLSMLNGAQMESLALQIVEKINNE